MKKIISLALTVVMLMSILVVSGCNNGNLALTLKNVPTITKPGVVNTIYTTPRKTNKNASETNYKTYLSINFIAIGGDSAYVPQLDKYGFGKIGIRVDCKNLWRYPAVFEMEEITAKISIAFEMHRSSRIIESCFIEDFELKFTPDSTGKYYQDLYIDLSEYDFWKNNVYLKYGFNPRVVSSKVTYVAGTCTFEERNEEDFKNYGKPTAVPTATPAA